MASHLIRRDAGHAIDPGVNHGAAGRALFRLVTGGTGNFLVTLDDGAGVACPGISNWGRDAS
jgi:hypothetical protein